jgi:zinc D-Ala-D-Ala carboxypeptidase
MQLSRHFSLAALTYSDTAQRRGLDNTPSPAHLHHLRHLAEILEEIQVLLGQPLQITSAYRSAALNAAVGGVPTSAHAQGLAADFTCAAFGSPFEVARAISAQSGNLRYDQLIHEYGRWVHFALAEPDRPPRGQLLSIFSAQQGYLDGLLPDASAVI